MPLILTCFYFLLACFTPGEDKLSFAYDGRGKKVSGGKEEEFGETLSEGDIVGCYSVSSNFLFLHLDPVLEFSLMFYISTPAVFFHRWCRSAVFPQEWSFYWCGVFAGCRSATGSSSVPSHLL